MAKQIWFGNESNMQWVPAPLIDSNMSRSAHVESIKYENGGGDVYRSAAHQKQYDFQFNGVYNGAENLNVFNKYASRFYGDGLCVFADPYIFESNMMSAPWATPGLVDAGWPNIYSGNPTFSNLVGTVSTNLATNPSFESGSGTVEVRRNLTTNPSSETVALAQAGSGTGTVTLDTSIKYVGSSSSKFVWGGPGSTGLGLTVGAVSGTAGVVYTVSAWVYWESGAAPVFQATDQSFNLIPSATGVNTPSATGVWQRVQRTFTLPVGATGFRVYDLRSSASTYYVDAVLVEASPILGDYFDGSTSAGGDFTYAWTGTANASASVQNGVGVASVTGGGNRIIYQSQQWASTGTRSLRVTPTSTATGTSQWGAAVARNSSGLMAQITGGLTYTAIAKFRQTAPQTGSIDNSRARRMYLGEFGNLTALASGPQAPNVAGESVLTWTFTAPTGISAGNLLLYLGGGTTAGNGDVWWDDFLLVEGTYTGDYFDGATTANAESTYAWTGTANASTSTKSNRVPANTPAKAATYSVTTTANTIPAGGNSKFVIPVPPGYTLHLGASGSSTGTAVVQALPKASNGFAGTPTNLVLLNPNGATRMNTTFVGTSDCATVTVYITRTSSATSTITLNSVMAQLYKTGTTPTLPADHVAGEGHSGLAFADDAIVEEYVYIDPPRKALNTTLIEVGAWRAN